MSWTAGRTRLIFVLPAGLAGPGQGNMDTRFRAQICSYSHEFPWPPSWSLPLGPILSGVELPDFPSHCGGSYRGGPITARPSWSLFCEPGGRRLGQGPRRFSLGWWGKFTHVAKTGQNAGVWTQAFCTKMAVSSVSDRPASSIRGLASQPITGAAGPEERSPPPRPCSSGSSAFSGNGRRSRSARDVRPRYTGRGAAT